MAQAFAYFVSDLHLSNQTPQTTARFIHFVEHIAPQAQRLYLLGDIFEFWVGDDMLALPLQQNIAQKLRTLSQTGTAIFWCPGNRDFLLGKKSLRAIAASAISDPCVITHQGQRILLSHGDQYCVADRAYMRSRRILHNAWIKRMFCALPFATRLWIAGGLRQKSAAKQMITDVDVQTLALACQQANAHTMIHGHTHKTAIHQHRQPQGYELRRYVLSDWDFDHATRGNYLALNDDGQLHFHPII